MRRRELADGWVVGLGGPPSAGTPPHLLGRRYPATVPGCIHTDLMAAGVIPDPVLDENEVTTAWVGRQDWDYRHELWWRPDGSTRQELVFDGLDTAAEIWLGGHRLGRTADMHRSYRFDVTGSLHDGSNPLSIRFESAWTYAERTQARLGARPGAYAAPYNMIRKMASSFGWDWGPATVTSGIWRPVRLETWSTARLNGVRPDLRLHAGEGRLRLEVGVARAPGSAAPLRLRVRLTGPGEESGPDISLTTVTALSADSTNASVQLTAPDVRPWWPRGFGAQPLYTLQVDLLGPAEERLDSWMRTVGFRNVAITEAPDEIGRSFAVTVNDRPLPVRGVNWIPDDVFPHRVSRARYAERLGQAADAGVNLVRVWGGGRYESEDFYDTCDHLGLLVWQDFAFACAAYPEEEPLRSDVEAEARQAVETLMPHPSLALWNGNNENVWGHRDWGWVEQLDGRTWGETYYREVLPHIVADVDPGRPYWPASPFSGWDQHPNDDRHGVSHVWDVWNALDYPAYRQRIPRFVAEFGWQAPAAWSTLTGAISQRLDDPADAPIAHRQKAVGGAEKLARGLGRFGIAQLELADWHFLTQVAQARAVTTSIEHYRAHPERCSGMIWWQLNDCWPAISWSLVDSAGRRKPAWYALRRAYAERLLTVQPLDVLSVVILAGPDAPWRGQLSLRRLDVGGAVLATAQVEVSCPPGGVQRIPIPDPVATTVRPDREVVVAELDGRRSVWWFAEDDALDLPTAEMSTKVLTRDGGYDVEVHAHSLVRELCLFADRIDPTAEVDDQLMTLLPGERTVLRVDLPGRRRRWLPAELVALTSRPVLRAVNDIQVQRARTRSDSSRRLVGADRKGNP
jgi:beta-mannosidase